VTVTIKVFTIAMVNTLEEKMMHKSHIPRK